jgi:EXLDI family protein
MAPVARGYDDNVPNKTIYVSDDDLRLYGRAQELAGGNLSAAISKALRRFVDDEEGRLEGFDRITVRVGPGSGRKVRFTGVLLGELATMGSGRSEHYRVYRGRKGKFVLHVEREPQWGSTDSQGRPAGWRGWIGIGDLRYTFGAGEATLEVVDSLDALREKVPAELYELVAAASKQPSVEDLDI